MSRDQIQINSCKEVVWPAPIVRQTSVKQNNVKVLQMSIGKPIGNTCKNKPHKAA